MIVGAGRADVVKGSYIVTLRTSIGRGEVERHARDPAAAHGGTLGRVCTAALRGFSVRLPEAAGACHP